MTSHASHAHHWLAFAERGLLRLLMIALGLALMIAGLGLGVTIVMLPLGIAIGFTGVGLVVWGSLCDLPIEE